MREDPEASELVMQRFRAEGINVLTGHQAKAFVVENGESPGCRACRAALLDVTTPPAAKSFCGGIYG